MEHRSGFVNIIGNPNVGKSTLMNALIGQKLSIITNKAQTTRHRILGILNEDNYQIVFSDTPGVIDPIYKLQESMMNSVYSSFQDADIIIYLIEIGEKGLKDKKIFIAPGSIFGSNGEGYIRISLCVSKDDIVRAIKRFEL